MKRAPRSIENTETGRETGFSQPAKSARICGERVVTIQDWPNRVTTFQYNPVSASPKNLLTTVIGPSDCHTAYANATFLLVGATSDHHNASGAEPHESVNGCIPNTEFRQRHDTLVMER